MVIVLGIVPDRPFLASSLKINAHVYWIGSCLQCIEIMLAQARKTIARHFNSMMNECFVQLSEAALARHKGCEGLRYCPAWLNAEKFHNKVANLAGVTAGWHQGRCQ